MGFDFPCTEPTQIASILQKRKAATFFEQAKIWNGLPLDLRDVCVGEGRAFSVQTSRPDSGRHRMLRLHEASS